MQRDSAVRINGSENFSDISPQTAGGELAATTVAS
jgi:hypothetical protein